MYIYSHAHMQYIYTHMHQYNLVLLVEQENLKEDKITSFQRLFILVNLK